MRQDHYMPAAFLGGFGASAASGKGRRARIAVRYRDIANIQTATSQDIAKEAGLYKLQSPPMGLSSDAIDRVWRSYEPSLPGAINAIEQDRYDYHDIQMILCHIAAVGVRHPDYIAEARRYLAAQGAPMSDVDLPQLQRIRTMKDALDRLAQANLALLFPAPDGRRFVMNDKGFTKLEEIESGRRGIFFPLSSRMTALIVLDTADFGGPDNDERIRRLALTPGAVEMLNEISWRQRRTKFVVGHRDDMDWIARLDDSKEIQLPLLGPYRGTSGGFFDWARL